jgi:hypothetical protein
MGEESGVKLGFLYGFLLTVGLSSFQFGNYSFIIILIKGYSIGVFNTMQKLFVDLFEWDGPNE